MDSRIYIEPETLKRAAENSREAFQEARAAVKNGSPEEIRAAIRAALDRSSDYRALLRANYHI